jgi:hypothetical protein
MEIQQKNRDKTGGRTKGTPNKLTNEVRQMLVNFLDEKFDEVTNLWSELDHREKISLFLQLSKIVLPKLSHDNINDEPNLQIDLSHLTTDEIRELLNGSD